MRGAATGARADRRALLGKVHIAVKAIGMVDDDYRALLERLTGTRSAADCDAGQLAVVIAELERLGFKAKPAAPRRANHPVAKKARALWISLYQLGAIGDPSERALERFAKRQLGVDRLQWADQAQGFRLIEALKAMAERHGWGQRIPARTSTRDAVRLLRDRLIGAQLVVLAELGAPPVWPIAGDRSGWTIVQIDRAARRLADDIRAARKACPAPS